MARHTNGRSAIRTNKTCMAHSNLTGADLHDAPTPCTMPQLRSALDQFADIGCTSRAEDGSASPSNVGWVQIKTCANVQVQQAS